MKLQTIKQLTGTILLESGLHIGAGDMEIHIGGTDNTVVKHPKTLEPYIPGSSLKGKIRSLLEHYLGLIRDDSPISLGSLKSFTGKQKENALSILKLFGACARNNKNGEKDKEESSNAEMQDILISRLIFCDCNIKVNNKEDALTEIKAENSINRVTGTACNPRFTERVPRGIEFNFTLSIREYEGDDSKTLEKLLKLGLFLLELDCLGGNGSRGYGKITFGDTLELDGNKFELYRNLKDYEDIRN